MRGRENIVIPFAVVVLYMWVIGASEADRDREMVKQHQCRDCENQGNLAKSCYPVQDYWCCECKAGTYVHRNCSANYPLTTDCKECIYNDTEQTYTSEDNHAQYCNASMKSCDNLPYTEFQKGSNRKNNKCICMGGYYAVNPLESGCKKHRECPKDFGVKVPGNSSHDVICERCNAGLCSNELSSTARCEVCKTEVSQIDHETTTAYTTADISTTAIQPVDARSEVPPVHHQQHDNCKTWKIVAGIFIGLFLFMAVVCVCLWRRLRFCENRERRRDRPRDGNQSDAGERRGDQPRDGTRGDDAVPLLDLTDRSTGMGGQDRSSGNENATPSSGPNHTDQELQVDLEEKEKINGAVPIVEKNAEKGKESVFEESDKISEIPEEDVRAEPFKTEKRENTGDKELDFAQIFRHNGYVITYDPPGDGHCQFAALVYLFNPEIPHNEIQQTAQKLRREVVEHIRSNPDTYKRSVLGNWDEYLSKMSRNEYGDHRTLQAVSDLRRKAFKVIQSSTPGKPIHIHPNNCETQTYLLLGHIDENHGMHYVCLAQDNDSNESAFASSARQPLSDSRLEGQRTESSSAQIHQHPPSVASCHNQSSSNSVPANIHEAAPKQPNVDERSKVIQEIMELIAKEKTEHKKCCIEKVLEDPKRGQEIINCLHRHSVNDVKKYTRHILEPRDEAKIGDIEHENPGNADEWKFKWLKLIIHRLGRKVTPLYLFTGNFELKIFIDDLMTEFVKKLQICHDNSQGANSD